MGPSWIVEHEAASANWCPEEQLESQENCQGHGMGRRSNGRERDSTSGHVKITCLYKTRGILIHFCTGRSSGYYLCWLGIKEG